MKKFESIKEDKFQPLTDEEVISISGGLSFQFSFGPEGQNDTTIDY